MTSLPTTKSMPTFWPRMALHQSLTWKIYQLLHFPAFHDVRVYTLKLPVFDPLGCSGACVLSHSTADMVEVFASVAIADIVAIAAIVAIVALLLQRLCLFLLVTFLDMKSSVHLRIATISA